MNELILYFLCSASVILSAINIALMLFARNSSGKSSDELKSHLSEELRAARQEMSGSVQTTVASLGAQLGESQKLGLEAQSRIIAQLSDQLLGHNRRTDARLQSMSEIIETRLSAMRDENGKKLDQMREVVEEKLQATLNERLSQSFSQVGERLEQVYKGLGEMQTLASGVGDLKKILSNVKTRGILGEIQLEAILSQMLSPEQYESNIKLNSDTNDRVEFAVKLPGDGNSPVLMPIDAKFPSDLYASLADAYDSGDSDAVAVAGKLLEQRIKQEAKSIKEKYICPPATTDFAVMFLPVEGLYAEVVRRGLVEVLQRDYKVTVAGPTTLAALLSALQMGFRTLAIQRRSSEVWELLGAVRTEFERFAGVLDKALKNIRLADKELDTLVGTRTRAIQRRLRNVATLPESQATALIGGELEYFDLGADS